MPLHQYKAALQKDLYLRSAPLSKAAGLPLWLFAGNLALQRNFSTLYIDSHHGRSTANAGNYPVSISGSDTHIAGSWPGLEQQELPTSFPTLVMFQSLASTGQAHRHYTVWTRVQTNHICCLLKIQRTSPASCELADQFCTAVHPCQVVIHVQAVYMTLGALQLRPLQLAR